MKTKDALRFQGGKLPHVVSSASYFMREFQLARHREFDEELLQAKAMSLFWKNGFHNTTLTCLSKETGIKRGSLYNAYSNKETIFLKVFQKYTDRYLIEIGEALQHPVMKTALRKFFDVAIEKMRVRKTEHGCLTTRIIIETTDEMEDIRASITAYLDLVESEIFAMFERAKRAGQFSGNSQSSTRLLMSVTRGMAVLEQAYDDEERLQEIAGETIRLLTLHNQ